MATVNCIQDWSDNTKLGTTTAHATVENGENYEFIKSYTYQSQEWYIVRDTSEARLIHAPASKFA